MTEELKTLNDLNDYEISIEIIPPDEKGINIAAHKGQDTNFYMQEFDAVLKVDLRAKAIHRAKTKIGYLMNNSAVKKFWFNKGNPMVVIDTLQDTALISLAWTTFGEINEIIEFNNLTEADLK